MYNPTPTIAYIVIVAGRQSCQQFFRFLLLAVTFAGNSTSSEDDCVHWSLKGCVILKNDTVACAVTGTCQILFINSWEYQQIMKSTTIWASASDVCGHQRYAP